MSPTTGLHRSHDRQVLSSKPVAEIGQPRISSEKSFAPWPARPPPEPQVLHPDPVGQGSRRAVILRKVWAWPEPCPTGRLDVSVSKNWTQVPNNWTLLSQKPAGRVTGIAGSVPGTAGRPTGIRGHNTVTAGASTGTARLLDPTTGSPSGAAGKSTGTGRSSPGTKRPKTRCVGKGCRGAGQELPVPARPGAIESGGHQVVGFVALRRPETPVGRDSCRAVINSWRERSS